MPGPGSRGVAEVGSHGASESHWMARGRMGTFALLNANLDHSSPRAHRASKSTPIEKV